MDEMKGAGVGDVARDPRAETAVAAARAAGAVARGYFGTGVRIEWKGEGAARSPVTIADREAEQAARMVISGRFPARFPRRGVRGDREPHDALDP